MEKLSTRTATQSIAVPNDITLNRILDANLDRAREGLRVIEEWCRLGLEDAELTHRCKQLRQELAQWHRPDYRLARNTPEDPGTGLTHPQEQQRPQVESVLEANLARVQEALRVLEEYGKVEHPQFATACKQMRYRVYTLESQLLTDQAHQQLLEAKLYLVTAPCQDLCSVVEAALRGGLRLVQYRDKQTHDCERLEHAQKLQQLCRQYNALFIVNDRVDLAVAVNADGVHLGQQDIPMDLARKILGPHRLVGRSTTNPAEMERAIAEGADYIGVGPVYATPTKADKPAAGLDYVRYAAANAPMPWFAIGGIDYGNLPDVMAAGAQRIAVVRALIQAEFPKQMTEDLLQQLQRA